LVRCPSAPEYVAVKLMPLGEVSGDVVLVVDVLTAVVADTVAAVSVEVANGELGVAMTPVPALLTLIGLTTRVEDTAMIAVVVRKADVVATLLIAALEDVPADEPPSDFNLAMMASYAAFGW
jgi:hypothetical protein